MNKIRAAITGVGGYVPDYILTNKELETMVETSDEWITTRTGIKERRILKGEDKGVSVLGIEAVKNMLAKTGTDPKEIDLLIFATVTADMTFPATANIVATAVGAVNAFSYDMGAACSGFLYGLMTGASFIESGRYKKSSGDRRRQDVGDCRLYRPDYLHYLWRWRRMCSPGTNNGRCRHHRFSFEERWQWGNFPPHESRGKPQARDINHRRSAAAFRVPGRRSGVQIRRNKHGGCGSAGSSAQQPYA